MTQNDFNTELLDFLENSPTPFHATQELCMRLEAAGFTELDEADTWALEKGKKYYLTRNDSSLIAFVYGTDDINEVGVSMVGAHTDSPCLKLKPNAIIHNKGYIQLGVEVYGGVLFNTRFHRGLSLARRVSGLDEKC